MTQLLNQMTYSYHAANLYSIALNRIKWLNLPEGCNSRFLEETLLNQGQAVIFQWKGLFGQPEFYSTQVTSHGPWNLYNNPTKLVSIGNNGWHVRVPWQKGVMVWETQDRLFNTMTYITMFASRLAEADRVADINLNTLKKPYFITGPEERIQDAMKMMQSVDNNEPAIFGNSRLDQIQWNVLQTGAEYIGEEMQYRKQYLLNEFMTFLGIENPGLEKQERMTQEEIERRSAAAELKRLNYLTPRRDAAAVLNKRFGLNIEVVWNSDNLTESYNFMHNLEKQAELKDGEEVSSRVESMEGSAQESSGESPGTSF